MHVSLDSALGRQRRLNSVGESVLQIAPNAAAAYSLRSLTGGSPKVVRVRRASDNGERDFTSAEINSGEMVSWVNQQVVAPLDIQALEADGRTGDFLIAKAAYSLRSLGTRQATVTSSGDTDGDTSGKFVIQARRNVDGKIKSFTATEVTDGTLTSFVNESFTSSLPLDVAGSAAAAYGLRNLSSSYTGNVVEVRRSSDDTTRDFTAAEITDGTLLAFVGTGGSDNGFVKTWYDQSGNSNDAAQATAASQPKIVDAGALLTDGGLLFDGDDDFFDTGSSLTLGTEFFITNVLNINAPVDPNGSIIGNSASGGDDRLFINTVTDQLSIRNGGVNIDSSLVTSRTQDNLSTYQASSSSFTFVLDGTTDAKSALSTGQSFRYIGGGTGFNLSANMKELIIYDSDQSDKRRAIEESIATANGITLGSFNRDGFVKTWYDQSVTNEAGDTATGNHATQATPASQPKIVSAGSLLADGIDFDGVDDGFFTASNLTDTLQSATIFALTQDDTTSGTVSMVRIRPNGSLGTLDGLAWEKVTDKTYGSITFIEGANKAVGANATGQGTRNTSKNLNTLVYQQSQILAYENGALDETLSTVQSGSVPIGDVTLVDQLWLGQNFGDNARPFNGTMQEVIIYFTDQSDNRTALEANIGETYGIDLPAGVDPGFDQVDGFVETWYDQSGNGSDATQATAGSQPKIVDAGALVADGNSNPEINFTPDSSNGKFLNFGGGPSANPAIFDGLTLGSNFSMFWKANIQNTGNSSRTISTDTSFYNIIMFHSTSMKFFITRGSSTSVTFNNLNIRNAESLNTLIGDGSNVIAHQNGGSATTASFTVPADFSLNRLGSSTISSGSTRADFNTSEFILYDTNQSANRVALETNINDHYSIF